MAKAAHHETEMSARSTGVAPLPFGKRPLRTFALAIALPTLVFYVVSAALVIGALGLMAREMDRLEDDRGVAAMHSALDSFLEGLGDAVSDEGTWNEAYLNVVANSDPAWMDTTWGATARIGSLYDTVVVTDAAGIVAFGEDGAGAISGDIALRFPAARTMLKQLDKGIAATGDATTITGFASDSMGTVGLAAISIHRTTPGENTVPRHLRRVLWIARHLTPVVLQDFAVRHQAPLPELVQAAEPDSSAFDLRDIDGNVTGTVAWVPDRPGESVFRQAILTVTGIFFVIGIVMVLGLGAIRRAMVRRSRAVAAALAAGPSESVAAVAREAGATAPSADQNDPDISTPIDGITAGSFTIAYQPVFDLRAEAMAGVSGLLRWTRADQSVVTQESLPPRALAILLERIGILAIRHASGEMAPLLGVTLSMSVSPAQLRSPVFVEKLAATLSATGLPAGRLALRIDAALLPQIEVIAPALAALRLMGVSISLDNFVLSPATIPYLAAGLVDRICLSPQLTRGLGGDKLRLSLVEASVAAARGNNLAVVAPAMAERSDVAPLLRLGCREFQGDMFAPAMPLPAFTALVLAPAHAETRKAG